MVGPLTVGFGRGLGVVSLQLLVVDLLIHDIEGCLEFVTVLALHSQH